MRPRIVVIGSANMDYVVQTERFPNSGETLIGKPLQLFPGGKGANQAATAARLACGTGVDVDFVGNVGDDSAGSVLVESLSSAGVRVEGIRIIPDFPSGSAMIWRDIQGNNCIIVSPAANYSWSTEQLQELDAKLAEATVVLLQMEVPYETNKIAITSAAKAKAFIIVDPAPAMVLPRDFLENVDLLTPNEIEACILLAESKRLLAFEELAIVASRLLDLGPRAVLIKLGERGAFYKDSKQEIFEPALNVLAKDTTAAGDVFNGAFAVAMGTGGTLREAIKFACTAAAISVSRIGAQSSIPKRTEVVSFALHEHLLQGGVCRR